MGLILYDSAGNAYPGECLQEMLQLTGAASFPDAVARVRDLLGTPGALVMSLSPVKVRTAVAGDELRRLHANVRMPDGSLRTYGEETSLPPTSSLASEGRLRDHVDRAMYIDLLQSVLRDSK